MSAEQGKGRGEESKSNARIDADNFPAHTRRCPKNQKNDEIYLIHNLRSYGYGLS